MNPGSTSRTGTIGLPFPEIVDALGVQPEDSSFVSAG
jgi:hypothetical protein